MTGAPRSPVVDTESAREFMREALARVTPEELDAIAGECEDKHRRVRALLGSGASGTADEAALRRLLRSVFATRRRVDEVLAPGGAAALGGRVHALVHGPGPAADRLQAFVEALHPLSDTLAFDLGSECLHFTEPARHWLWTRWVWDPRTRTGALPLVTMEEYELDGGTVAGTYRRVGEATAFVQRTGEAAGFARIGAGGFGVDVYLASVYAVYVFTTVRMRMTQEFNRVIPPLPELARRLLGVWKPDA
jgi:hypothetical protein